MWTRTVAPEAIETLVYLYNLANISLSTTSTTNGQPCPPALAELRPISARRQRGHPNFSSNSVTTPSSVSSTSSSGISGSRSESSTPPIESSQPLPQAGVIVGATVAPITLLAAFLAVLLRFRHRRLRANANTTLQVDQYTVASSACPRHPKASPMTVEHETPPAAQSSAVQDDPTARDSTIIAILQHLDARMESLLSRAPPNNTVPPSYTA
ncbi:hypothetical protein C8J57DRAFT_1338860 [Mycena rebaudengoi]|nr:hypothetical protein C8J57DRAFT_1338860 [Mycena rebaudengoi]